MSIATSTALGGNASALGPLPQVVTELLDRLRADLGNFEFISRLGRAGILANPWQIRVADIVAVTGP